MKNKKVVFIVVFFILLLFVFYALYSIFLKEKILRNKLKELNVILITIDTLRADYVSIYGDKAETSNIEKIAKEGVIFDRCIAQTPLTLPSHTTILSGTYPLYHNVRDNGGFIVPEELTLVSEILKSEGFKTGAFIAAYVLHSKWGLNQGFDVYEDTFDMTKYKAISLGSIQKRADEVLKEAEKWIKKVKRDKFFAWIHLYDPHTPYAPPPPYSEMFKDRPYRGEVEYTDYQLGKFFSFLRDEGIMENSIIVITSDHGESLGEHKEETHGFFIYESTVWAPLIIRTPFSFPKKRVKNIVEHVDIVPTLLDMLGIRYDKKSMQGRSLLGVIFGESGEKFNKAYTETFYPKFHYGWSELRAIYHGSFKYILAPSEELYDLENDPEELLNLSLKESSKRRKLKRLLEKFIKEKSEGAILPVKKEKLSPEEVRRLSALGYVSGFVNVKGKKLPDPKDKIGILNSLRVAKKLLKKEKYSEAIEMVNKILSEDPEIVDAYMLLGNLYYRKKDFKEALVSFKEVLKRKPDYNFAMINIINCYVNMGKLEEAERVTNDFIKKFPNDSAFYFELGKINFLMKKKELAEKYLKKAIDVYPKNTQAMNKLAEMYIVDGRLSEALELLKKVEMLNPTMKELYYNMAQIEEKKGNILKAIEYYRKEIENNPKNFKAYYNMAVNLKNIGKINEALSYYEKTIEIKPDFNIPYFMVAKILFDLRSDLEKAISLCKKGVELKPYNKYTVFGYYLLADIYSYMGYSTVSRIYYEKGRKILKNLNSH